ncbi:uncharacterized protein LOC101451308 isoform X2 [Ceratitis capitata]|uniref:uncharacterized protein LOC101451308 isoform X2 n=1 Tax=Ceratitis capitata TaxID=7213 RepID=UPI00032A1C9D|nr:uncharacterized protein LOC101451308 isoform X2 [Ceratitis capitata]
MSLQLSPATIQKLTHESLEIRLRTLEQISNKLSRAFEHNESLEFKAGELCKQLIRWFGFEPLSATQLVLKLLIKILRSSYSEQAIGSLGSERFMREMEKVRHRVRKLSTESEMVDEIKVILSEYNGRKNTNITNKEKEVIEAISLVDRDKLESVNKSKEFLNRFGLDDYEPAWSKPTAADFAAISLIADILTNSTVDKAEITNTLLHLEVTMHDYPAEYMLQIPHVFLSLLNLYEPYVDEEDDMFQDVARTIKTYLHMLLLRLKERQNISAYSTNSEMLQLSGYQQLKLNTIIKYVLEQSVQILESLVCELRREIQGVVEIISACLQLCRIENLTINKNILSTLHKTILGLRRCFEQDGHFTLNRIKYLLIVCLLDDMLMHNKNYQTDEGDHQLLAFLLGDYTFKVNFPQRYRHIEECTKMYDFKTVFHYEKLRNYDSCMRFAISLMRHPDSKSEAIVMNGKDICVALESLKKPTLREKAAELLLELLRLKYEPLKIHAYKMISMAVKRHFACLMQCERYCIGLANEQLMESQVLGVPLSSELILHLIYTCGDNLKQSICKISEEILLLILKSQNLLGEHWPKFLELFLPLLPVLQCCTHSQSIVELVQKLLDPDAKQLPFLTVLQGNIVFMFHRDSKVRSEAITRLIYIINSVPDADKYVPNLLHISDVIPNDICIMKNPREYQSIFPDITPSFERDTLHNLLSMLEIADVEPVIRKTTLMQLNIMCQQWHMLASLCEESAHYLILQALENSLSVASYEDYTGAAVPAIGMLCKMLLYDAALRSELSETPNIYVLLLRALCLYQNDMQLRQDVCVCLFLLLYTNFLVVLGNQRVEAPTLVGNLGLPLRCVLQSFEQGNITPYEYENLFKIESECNSYLRHLLAISLCDNQIPVPKQYLEEQKNYDFNVELQLTLRDWRLMNATIPKQNVQRFLRAILNATDHSSLINASISLQLQFFVHDQKSSVDATLMPDKIADELYNLIGKYLQLPPGNEADYQLFEALIDLCQLCVNLPLQVICVRLVKELVSDFRHAIIDLLKNVNISLRLYNKLTILLANVLKVVTTLNGDDTNLRILHSNLFELIFQLIIQHFPKRDLLRIRCLLGLLKTLSAFDITITDEKLMSYCKRLIKLSLALKSFTQTGSRWQIDCLTIVCQLYAQLEEPQRHFSLCESSVKYLSGLCGHCDRQVRALAWCILTHASCYVGHDSQRSVTFGFRFLEDILSYLPGGFMACCLCTFLDVGETIVVRQLAANLFVSFLTGMERYEEAYKLLTRHKFLPYSIEAIRGNCILERHLPPHFDLNFGMKITSCELISCLCRICYRMLPCHSLFASELCESDFMFKLYELLKIPLTNSNPAYYIMWGDICRLYAACYPTNFSVLKRTLCRDQVWLTNFYKLLETHIDSDAVVINILQLFLVLCKDELAYAKLCFQITKAPELLLTVFLRAFTISNINTPLQRYSLATLSLLLIKAQNNGANHANGHSFLIALEQSVEIANKGCDNIICTELNNSEEKISKQQHNIYDDRISLDAKDNAPPAPAVTRSAAVLLFAALFRLFQHLYSAADCKFESAPSKAQVQVSETMGILLSLSLAARMAAKQFKLFDKITQAFNVFFDQFKCSATTFVRRYGDNKKMTLVKNFQILLNVQIHWFSASDAALTNNLQCVALSKLIMQLWPWLPHSGELKELVLKVLCYHSEHSFVMCQQFSVVFSGFAHSLLQLVIKLIVAETTRVKPNTSENYPVIRTGLRMIMNCCSCIEGRVTIIKAHMMDMFDSMHPFHLKSPKIKAEILHSWLEFWELFSRYPEGANTRNLRALCDVVSRSPPSGNARLLTLRILRNMCFLPSNRSALVASTDFICTVNTIIEHQLNVSLKQKCTSYEEQLIACVGVWKLASGGAKYVAMLRSTNLAKHLRQLHERLSTLKEADPKQFSQMLFAGDLFYVLGVLLDIFNN